MTFRVQDRPHDLEEFALSHQIRRSRVGLFVLLKQSRSMDKVIFTRTHDARKEFSDTLLLLLFACPLLDDPPFVRLDDVVHYLNDHGVHERLVLFLLRFLDGDSFRFSPQNVFEYRTNHLMHDLTCFHLLNGYCFRFSVCLGTALLYDREERHHVVESPMKDRKIWYIEDLVILVDSIVLQQSERHAFAQSTVAHRTYTDDLIGFHDRGIAGFDVLLGTFAGGES